MIYAELQNGERISASELSYLIKSEEKKRTEMLFFCPGCKEPVFFKNGLQKISHFSHYQESNCHSFSEGETQAHLSGKIKLFEWCKMQNLSVEMEAWLPELKQRPDLLITLSEERKIALEYQCSPLSFKKLKERTEGYHSIGCKVLWICGVEYTPGTRLLDKQTSFFTWSKKGGCGLTCLDSKKGLLMSYRQFNFNQFNQLQYTIENYYLKKLNFNEFLEISTGGSLQKNVPRQKNKQNGAITQNRTGKAMKQSERLLLLRRKDEHHRNFLEKIYLERHELRTLPGFLFTYPIKSIYWLTPSYIWKYTFLCWLQGRKPGEVMDSEIFFELFQKGKIHKIIHTRPTNFIPEKQLIQPLLIFLDELIQEGILTVIGEGLWILNRKPFLTNYEKMMNEEPN